MSCQSSASNVRPGTTSVAEFQRWSSVSTESGVQLSVMLKSIAATCKLGRPRRKVHMGSARWWKLCETNYILAGVLIFMFTFIMLLNEHSNAGIWQRVRGTACRDDEFAVNSECRRAGEALPRGFMVATSDLSLRRLDRNIEAKVQREMPRYLLAMPVGVKQKKVVDQIVQKFPLQNFTIMLFHYDGVVDQWSDLPWSNQCIHIVALHQTKWWYAKRFLHPDIVEEYNYIFLWDEDLGVGHFDPIRYLNIMKEEGLEISQPALDPDSPSIHHDITRRDPNKRVHRRVMRPRRPSDCTVEDNGPPCTGWVEVMAPVFSKSAWRCTWYLIQNDLIHGWGLDMKLGYCVQGKRSERVGVIDEEYVVHKGIPTLRKGHRIKKGANTTESGKFSPVSKPGVRRRPAEEIGLMTQRWEEAIRNDPSWVDPYSYSSIGDVAPHLNSTVLSP